MQDSDTLKHKSMPMRRDTHSCTDSHARTHSHACTTQTEWWYFNLPIMGWLKKTGTVLTGLGSQNRLKRNFVWAKTLSKIYLDWHSDMIERFSFRHNAGRVLNTHFLSVDSHFFNCMKKDRLRNKWCLALSSDPTAHFEAWRCSCCQDMMK